MATLLGDFTCHGAEHLLLQHPLTLFFELEFNRTPEAPRFFEAASLAFTGNIFFEPTLNPLHGGYATRADFFGKYGFDPGRPLCLWLPSGPAALDRSYAQVANAVREAGLNLAVKLHPWEYAFKKHGPPHPWGHLLRKRARADEHNEWYNFWGQVDVEAGARAGCATVFIDYGYDEKQPERCDIRAASLAEATDLILGTPPA